MLFQSLQEYYFTKHQYFPKAYHHISVILESENKQCLCRSYLTHIKHLSQQYFRLWGITIHGAEVSCNNIMLILSSVKIGKMIQI